MNGKSIGTRLKFFRTRAGKSQMDVELAIGASFGSICRLESGKVNPTKETVEKIAKFFDLTDRELDYLIGMTSYPPSMQDCKKAINQVENYFNKKGVIAYLVDDRFRLLTMSSSVVAILKLSQQDYAKVIGKTLIELMLNNELPIKKFFDINYEDNLTLIINRFYTEMNYMIDDDYYKFQLKLILNNPISKKIWDSVTQDPKPKLWHYSERKICFNINSIAFELRYTNEPLSDNKRFDVVEYLPTNELQKIILKFLR